MPREDYNTKLRWENKIKVNGGQLKFSYGYIFPSCIHKFTPIRIQSATPQNHKLKEFSCIQVNSSLAFQIINKIYLRL